MHVIKERTIKHHKEFCWETGEAAATSPPPLPPSWARPSSVTLPLFFPSLPAFVSISNTFLLCHNIHHWIFSPAFKNPNQNLAAQRSPSPILILNEKDLLGWPRPQHRFLLLSHFGKRRVFAGNHIPDLRSACSSKEFSIKAVIK